MKFADLSHIWVFWIIPVILLFLMVTHWRRRSRTEKIIAKNLWNEVIPALKKSRRGLKALLLLLSLIFIGLALLRPQWGYTLREFRQKGADLFILVDTSQSMKAQDLSPNRMERAKRELIDLARLLQGDRVGLIPFAGSSYVACPLTTDYEAFRPFIDMLDTDLIPVAGTDIAGALKLALDSLKNSPSLSKAVLLVTDGEATQGALLALVDQAIKDKVKIFVIGVGDPQGAPIPEADGDGFVTNEKGEVVLSKLDEASLKEIALKTGGTYVRSVTGDMDLEQIYLTGIKEVVEARELKSGQKMIPSERFQIPLAIGLLLLLFESLLGEQKKWLKLLFLLVALTSSSEVFAGNPISELKAQKAYENGDYARAIDVYEKSLQNHPGDSRGNFNLGDSYYRQGNFGLAEKNFLKTLNSSKKEMRGEALYNLGNTKYRQGQLQEAVDFYDKALQVSPAHENAKLNRDFVLKQLEKKKENQEDKKDQDQQQEPNKQDEGSEQKPDQPENRQQEQQQQEQEQQQQQKDQPEQPQEPNQGDEDQGAPDQGEERDEEKKGANGGLSSKEVDQMLESVGDDPKKSLQDIILRDTERKGIKSEGKNW